MKFSTITFLALLAPASWAGTGVTFTYKTADTEYTVSFDSSKIPERQMRELIILSPLVTDYAGIPPVSAAKDFGAGGSLSGGVRDKNFFALDLEQCLAQDPEYSVCAGKRNDVSSPNFLHNAEVNLRRSRRGLEWLQHLNYPKELQPVVEFLRRGLALSLWIEETRVRYYSTWDENVLREVHDGIAPGKTCAEIFRKLQAASSQEEKYRIAKFDWANCIRREIRRQLGTYPVSAWNAFLKAYGITETYKEQVPD
jgi:hypothetical protein